MDVFVARQPIFNRNKKIFAYELLFRSGMTNGFPGLNGETATSSLLTTSFFTVGIEKITGGRKSFINFTEELLIRGTPMLFPHNKIMVEILETVQPTEEIIEVCKGLRNKGYSLVLDDFVYAQKFLPLIELSKIIKVDFRSTSSDEIERMVEHHRIPANSLQKRSRLMMSSKRPCRWGLSIFKGTFLLNRKS